MSDNPLVIKEAIKFVAKGALNAFASDPHRFSTRGCGTCSNISAMIDEPWGCIKMALDAKKKALESKL